MGTPVSGQLASGFTVRSASAVVTTGTNGFSLGGNVTAGNYLDLIHLAVGAETTQTLTIAKASGTATIGTIGDPIQYLNITGTDSREIRRYLIPITGSGSLTMQGTYGETLRDFQIAMQEFSGLDATTPFTTGKVATGNANVATGGTIGSGNITPTVQPGVIVGWGWIKTSNGAAPTQGSGNTLISNLLWPDLGTGGTVPSLALQWRVFSSLSALASDFVAVAHFSDTYALAAVFNDSGTGGSSVIPVILNQYRQRAA